MKERRSISLKVVVLLLALVLAIGCVAGGTLAYLMATSSTVSNTFVAGNIGTLTLDETKGTSFTVIPGVDIEKDPTVTFNGNNITAYIFVKVEATGWTVSNDGMTYSIGNNLEMKWDMAEGWTKLDNVDGVYYREVAANNTASYDIIKDNKITVSSAITKDTINNYATSLNFTAYAIQKDGHDSVNAAWSAVSPPANH